MSAQVRCKMTCNAITPHQHQDGMSMVQFGAVWSPATGTPLDENALFGKLTPFATFAAAFTNQAACRLVVGQEYYVDFTPATDD